MSNGLTGLPRHRGEKRVGASERDGRPFREAVSSREVRAFTHEITLTCGHHVRRAFPAAQGAYCDVCGLENALGETLKRPGKSLARRALEARGSYAP